MKTIQIILLVFVLFITCNPSTNNSQRKSSEVSLTVEKLRTSPDSVLTKIKIDNLDREYEVKKGQIIVDSILIINNGIKPLKIESIKSKCDCTTVDFDNSRLIHPKESMVVRYKINTEDMPLGYNQRTISIIGNFFPYFKIISLSLYLN